jgi:hypothetical protein
MLGSSHRRRPSSSVVFRRYQRNYRRLPSFTYPFGHPPIVVVLRPFPGGTRISRRLLPQRRPGRTRTIGAFQPSQVHSDSNPPRRRERFEVHAIQESAQAYPLPTSYPLRLPPPRNTTKNLMLHCSLINHAASAFSGLCLSSLILS